MTILFYVPRWTKKGDLQVIIGSDYVVAGVRSTKEMVVQAQLAGRVNTLTSTWRLERQSNKRSRSRSTSGAGGNMLVARRDSNSNSSSGNGLEKKSASNLVVQKEEERTSSPPSSSDEASSSDLLARSADTFEIAGGWDSHWSHVRESSASTPPELTEAHTSMMGSGSPAPRLDQSMTLSEESGYIPSGSNSTGDGGVRSLESSIHSQSSASQTRSEDDAITDAKLVTLHLDKVDGGIWPFLVSGPASLSLIQQGSLGKINPQQQSLNAALSEALKQPNQGRMADQLGIGIAGEGDDIFDSSFTQSTITVDTMSSDDSATVLGTRGAQEDEEDLYEMDPTSLALMGIRHSKQGARSPFGSASTLEEARAFEYFKRAWRRAETPLATKRLVEDYLPLSLPQYNRALSLMRNRLTASLGGPSALARLYVSYARLHLPSFQDRQSPLAFPLGGLNNPFGGGHAQDHLSSPRSQGIQFVGHDALTYLREARNIDNNVVIVEEEWQEAQALAAQSPSGDESWRWDQAEGASEKASQGSRMYGERGGRQQKKRKKKKQSIGSKLHRDDAARGSDKFPSDQGLVFVLVSRVALISVMVAGGVAVAGWWRRAASAGGP